MVIITICLTATVLGLLVLTGILIYESLHK